MKNIGIWVAVAIGFAIYNTVTRADRDDSGAVVDAGRIDAFQMSVGDCFNDSTEMASDSEFEVSSVAGVPCSEPHDNEVYAIFDVSVDSYPEGDGMSELAFNSCLKRSEPFVGKDYQSSALDIFPMYPTLQSWKQRDDREVICAVYDMTLAKLDGSVAGSGL
jgi:hypothetical protein